MQRHAQERRLLPVEALDPHLALRMFPPQSLQFRMKGDRGLILMRRISRPGVDARG